MTATDQTTNRMHAVHRSSGVGSWSRCLARCGALAALIALTPACGDSDESEGTKEGTLELYSWWTNPGETDALAALLDYHKQKHPEVTIINATVNDSSNAQEQLRKRMA